MDIWLTEVWVAYLAVFLGTLGEAQIKQVALYVHDLGGGE